MDDGVDGVRDGGWIVVPGVSVPDAARSGSRTSRTWLAGTPSMSCTASQSSKAGWEGELPWLPKSSAVATIPVPK